MNNTAGAATTREQTSYNEPRRKAMKFAAARTSEQFNARNLSRFAVSSENSEIAKLTIYTMDVRNMLPAQG